MENLPFILGHVGAAVLAGALIGLERTTHGRAAGFRTHALVCLASSVLMVFPLELRSAGGPAADPTRMAQGIMTGIGFLGAGAIIREGLSIRGLTTAASIWVTAAVGILLGLGLWLLAAVTTVGALLILSVFQRIEVAFPAHHLAEVRVRFLRGEVPPRPDLVALFSAEGVALSSLAYRLLADGGQFEYSGTATVRDESRFAALAQRLKETPAVKEFSLEPY